MNDAQLLRYSRQLLLPQIDAAGQERLLAGSVLLVGLGGLGSPAALYLAAAGVGRLLLADFDRVELSNLQRQIVHRSADLGRPKVESARDNLRALNPEVEALPLDGRLEGEALERAVAAADVVVDGSDNFATRFRVNAAAHRLGKPLVSGAVIRLEGQVSVFDPRRPDSPCYRCLYKEEGEELDATCTRNGVLAPVAGIVGSIQATEALKLLAGFGEPLVGRLLLLDAATMEFRTLRLRRDPACPVCGPRP